jgi:hypothetical protein
MHVDFNGMVSHRVRLANAKEVGKELIGWLRGVRTGRVNIATSRMVVRK